MASLRSPLILLLTRFAARLRFPVLFAITAILFVVDLAVPDAIPFADEILLGLGTLVLGALRKRRDEGEEGADTPATAGESTE